MYTTTVVFRTFLNVYGLANIKRKLINLINEKVLPSTYQPSLTLFSQMDSNESCEQCNMNFVGMVLLTLLFF